MLSQRDYRILIGAAGWRHPEWCKDVFYSDDLPEDWYLSFYANEFPTVLIPDKDWNDVDLIEELVDEILEQATPGFKCVFELDMRWSLTSELVSKLSHKNNLVPLVGNLNKVKSLLSGLLVLVDINALKEESFCDEIISLNNDFKVCLELNGSNTELECSNVRAFCEQHSISVCWKGKGEVIVPEASTFWLARCDSSQEKKVLMQQLKTVIAEQLKRESLSREHILIVDGTPPKIDVIRNANVMMDLM